jgi:hypothetical protein
MKPTLLTLALCTLLLFSKAAFCAPLVDAPQKIQLSPAMVVNETGFGEAGRLVDEQALAGDPRGGRGGTPVTVWFPEWAAWHYPARAFVDLGRAYRLSDVYVYDGEGTGHVTVSAGKPFRWTALFTDDLSHYNVWNAHPVTVTTRYLEVMLADAGTKAPEVVVYGTAAGPKEAEPATAPHALPTMDQLIGVNAFIDDPLDKMTVGGFVREYHNWGWDEEDGKTYPGYPANQNKWNPSYGAGGGWNFDGYYARLKAAGVTVCPAVQGGVAWLRGGKPSDKPVPSGQSAAEPASYAAHADHLFQYAARYGNVQAADATLKVAPDQPRRSGLGLLHYYENWNEEDGWWGGRASYFQPQEFAAMCSADYDGDQGRMGRTFGVKNADPQAKLVMGGLAGLSLDYVKTMKAWADANRGGSFPCDVLNFHHYSNTGGEQQKGKVGISPEADDLRGKAAALVDYSRRWLPGKEVWVTEFGYDTNPQSPQRAPAIGAYSQEEVQGQWLVRSYLALAAAGVDRAAMFMLRDVNPADATQFSSSGLVTEKGKWEPKASWYYVHTLRDRLAGMHFAGEQPSGSAAVRIYRFQNAAKPGGAYVVWRPTTDGSMLPGYTLTVGRKPTKVTLVTLAKGKPSGAAAPLPLAGGRVTLAVSERPVLVLVNRR